MLNPDERISREDYNSWLHHPVTHAIADARKEEIDRIKDFLVSGGVVDADKPQTMAVNMAFHVGMVKGLSDSLEPPSYLYESSVSMEDEE